MTFDEAVEALPPEVQIEINAIVGRAGTTDADFAVFEAAARLLAELRAQLGAIPPDEPKFSNEGYEALWLWFGLSRSSWLTLPRVLMHAMPDAWQGAMAKLLQDGDEIFQNMPAQGYRVQVTDMAGRLIKTPEWLINYRHPNRRMIEKIKGNT